MGDFFKLFYRIHQLVMLLRLKLLQMYFRNIIEWAKLYMVKLSWRGFSFAFIFTTRKANTMEYFMCWHNQMDEIPCQHITPRLFFKKPNRFVCKFSQDIVLGSSQVISAFWFPGFPNIKHVSFESFMIKVSLLWLLLRKL